MAKMKMKFDAAQVKQFLFDKGERVGLIAAGALLVLFLFLGVMTALGSRSPEKDILQAASSLQSQISGPEEPAPGFKVEVQPPTYPAVADLGPFVDPSLWFQEGQVGDTKRRNPEVFPIGKIVEGRVKDGTVQTDVVMKPVLAYVMDPGSKTVTVFKDAGGTATTGAGGGAAPTSPGPMGAGSTPAQAMYGGGAGGYGAAMFGGAGTHDGAPVMKTVQARRMVIVSSIFPYAEQVEEFRKKLRLDSVQELFQSKDTMPQVLGLNVYRAELGGDGKPGDWQKVYTADPKTGKVVVNSPTNAELLRTAVYDESVVMKYPEALEPGLVEAVPKLAVERDSYPHLQLEGLVAKEGEEVAGGAMPGMPKNPMQQMYGGGKGYGPPPGAGGGAGGSKGFPGMQPGGAKGGFPGAQPGAGGGLPGTQAGALPGAGNAAANQVEVKTEQLAYTKLAQPWKGEFGRRFKGTVFPFNPDGAPTKGPGKGLAGAMPYMPNQPTATDKKEKKKAADGEDEDDQPDAVPTPNQAPTSDGSLPATVLVRFLDADVQPGKTYVYAVQVRMRNPNFEKHEQVVYRALADVKELVSGWTITPPATVPPDWHYYVVDQFELAPGLKAGFHKFAAKGDDIQPADKTKTAVQIHHWAPGFHDNDDDRDHPLGDWAILERILVKRGEVLGRAHVGVDLPEWNEQHEQFERPGLLRRTRGKGPRPKEAAVVLDFVPPNAPLVADFTGGKGEYAVGKKSSVYDDGPLEMLLLSPDGGLLARDSRTDSAPDTPQGSLRKENYDHWRDRINVLMGLQSQAGASGRPPQPGPGNVPNMPKGPGRPGGR
jgi:hypothetical protein